MESKLIQHCFQTQQGFHMDLKLSYVYTHTFRSIYRFILF
jgi:hypothetical protein